MVRSGVAASWLGSVRESRRILSRASEAFEINSLKKRSEEKLTPTSILNKKKNRVGTPKSMMAKMAQENPEHLSGKYDR
jgi:hypothetical protein